MNAFVKYSIARLLVLAGSVLLVWLATFWWLEIGSGYWWFVLIVALLLSAVVSVFLLSGLRNQVVSKMEQRGAQLKDRFEESRSAEDID